MANPQHSTYRSLVQNMWADGRIVPEEVTTLTTMQSQLGIGREDAATIERDVMGQTKEEALVAGMGTNVPGSLPLDSQSAPSPGSSDVLGTFSGGRTFVSASDEQTGPQTLSNRATTAGSNARSSSPGHLQTGDLVADRFEVLGILGEGGMGQVLKVRDTKLDAVRAMKVVRPELLHRGDILERFRHEVTTSQKLAHPNIVRVFDYGEDEARGIHFLTMGFVDGMTLRKWLKQKRRTKSQVTIKEFTAIAQGLCAALQYAHRFTVHRDLKPENIMLDRASRGIKLMDFGIAKAFDANRQFVTAGPMGTVYYAAPEQERGEQVDQRADIYSLGVILYEVLSGEIPRAGSKPISTVRSDVSPSVAKAIETAMAASPTDRFPSVSVFAKALIVPSSQPHSESVPVVEGSEPPRIAGEPNQGSVNDDDPVDEFKLDHLSGKEAHGTLETRAGLSEQGSLNIKRFKCEAMNPAGAETVIEVEALTVEVALAKVRHTGCFPMGIREVGNDQISSGSGTDLENEVVGEIKLIDDEELADELRSEVFDKPRMQTPASSSNSDQDTLAGWFAMLGLLVGVYLAVKSTLAWWGLIVCVLLHAALFARVGRAIGRKLKVGIAIALLIVASLVVLPLAMEVWWLGWWGVMALLFVIGKPLDERLDRQ